MVKLHENFYNTYKDIYHHRYKFSKNERKDSFKLIKKNLLECKISKSNISKLDVLNIGTGREAYAFLNLNVNSCELVDLSKKTKLQAEIYKKKYKNFKFQITDFCKDKLKLKIFNFLYLNGVFHHLHNPEKGLRNILKNSKIGSKYFFRIYRSGSMKFYIIDYIRDFINIKDQKLFNKIFKTKYKIKNLKIDLSHENPLIHFHEMCVDNFFVPNLYLFNLKKFIKKFDKLGLKIEFNNRFKNYDHSVSKKDNTGISLCFKKIRETKIKNFKLITDDQIKDIKYKEKYIKKTNFILSKNLGKIKKLNKTKKINLAIDLMFISQGYRIFKYYYSNRKKTEKLEKLNNLCKKYSSPKKIHMALQTLIRLAVV